MQVATFLGSPAIPFASFWALAAVQVPLPEENCSWVIAVSFSGSAWGCTPLQLDDQYPTADFGGPTPPTPCYKVEQTSAVPGFFLGPI